MVEEAASDDGGSWDVVAKNPMPFLSLELCSEAWLINALPKLLDATVSVPLAGPGLTHNDVRSDNICFVGSRVVLIDWNFAATGNGMADDAFWLPSLHSEGGPAPDELRPDAAPWAAVAAGFFAARAGLAQHPEWPPVRHIQLSQLLSALPWAVRALGLPPLDGANAPR
jgi:aminoglycoside phosphotransferase (APT) family kinase protein